MSSTYADLISNVSPCVSEKPHHYQLVTERHLQAIWLEQKYFKDLVSSSGEKIEVISPGIWNEEAGPDFLKAHLRIGNQEWRGDVEIHLSDESWQQHGHHEDKRYNQVILHLSLWHPKNPQEIKKQNGLTIIKAYLEDHLTISLARIVQLIDLDLYPYRKFVGSGRCAHDLYRTLPQVQINNLFKNAAYHRLTQKYKRLQTITEKKELILGAGIAQALGYKQNADSFLQLFLWLSSMTHLSETELISCAIGACGFYSDYYQKKWSHSFYYQTTLEPYFKMKHEYFPFYSLVLNQIRPFNHPIRRIIYLVKCLKDPHFFSIYNNLLSKWQENWSLIKKSKDWTLLRLELQGQIPTYEDEYWNRHYLFENEPKTEYISLLGEDLKKEILVNTFMPILFDEIQTQKNESEVKAFQNFYATFPSSKTGKSRYLVHRFFGDSFKGLVLNKAEMTQGAYQLHHDFCIHFEASCEGCPFVERYKSANHNKNLDKNENSLAKLTTYEFNSPYWI